MTVYGAPSPWLIVPVAMVAGLLLSVPVGLVAAPTVNAVNVALENQSASVPPPTIAVNPDAPRIVR